jgi:hypothetical protein
MSALIVTHSPALNPKPDSVVLDGFTYVPAAVVVSPPPPPPPPVDVSTALLGVLRADMTLAMEGLPDGFEHGDWANHERAKAFDPVKFPNMQPWYVCYEESGGNPAPACGVLLTMAEGWAALADGTWQRVIHDDDGVGGGNLFPENWISPGGGGVKPGGGSKPAITRQDEGGTVINLGKGSPNDPNFLFHFWDNSRYDIRKARVTGFVTAIRARLDPKTYDPHARYVMAAGCDKYGPNGENGWDQMTGRFKRVDKDDRIFTSSCGTFTTPPPMTIGIGALR